MVALSQTVLQQSDFARVDQLAILLRSWRLQHEISRMAQRNEAYREESVDEFRMMSHEISV